jgi:hypothetical protein
MGMKMARIRTIKPEFFTSADIVSLTPLARLFYIALWCESDREGRLNWNSKTLKMRYMPADNCNVDVLAEELINAKLIEIYVADGRNYAEIVSFKKHQVINNRESESSIPPRVKVASPREQGEGKEGRERKEDAKRETTLPKDFGISENLFKWAEEKGNKNLEKHLEFFIGRSKAKGYKYIDWEQAFQNAVRENWAKIEDKPADEDWYAKAKREGKVL